MDCRDADLSLPLHTDSTHLEGVEGRITGVSFASLTIPLSPLLAELPPQNRRLHHHDGTSPAAPRNLKHTRHAPRAGKRHARLFGMFGMLLRLRIPCLPALRSFAPHVVHLVDPILLSVQALIALQTLFPSTPIVTSQHTNVPTYTEIFGHTLVPFPSTAPPARERLGKAEGGEEGRGWGGVFDLSCAIRTSFLRSPSSLAFVVFIYYIMMASTLRRVFPPSTLQDAGVDFDEGRECSFALHFTLLAIGYQSRVPSFLPHHSASFSLVPPHSTPISTHRSPSLRALWGASSPADVVILPAGRLSPEKNLSLVVWGVARLGRATRAHTRLVFIGNDPHLSTLQRLCAQLGVDAISLGQLTGRRLGGGAEWRCYEVAISIRDDFAERRTE
ncbi:hypothetical protein B0H13DRAFT_2655949 [Mycena leptocephala]|nr:hypothetical protein B0H13DRAFT_2655949 [Mycena leptocephala]